MGNMYCSNCGQGIDAQVEFCPACGARQGIQYRPADVPNWEPHRGTAILVIGILSLFVVPFVLGPLAWIWGNQDLRKMKDGLMDPEGKGNTEAGRICGMIATILSLIGLG